MIENCINTSICNSQKCFEVTVSYYIYALPSIAIFRARIASNLAIKGVATCQKMLKTL